MKLPPTKNIKEEIERAWMDALLYGQGYIMFRSDGKIEYVHPRDIYKWWRELQPLLIEDMREKV